MNVSAGLTAQLAMTQSLITTSMIKMNVDQQKSVANMIDQTAQSIPSGGRGGLVNISA